MAEPEVKTPYMMYKRVIVQFVCSDGRMKTYVFRLTKPDIDVKVTLGRLVFEAPEKHRARRESRMKVYCKMLNDFPDKLKQWNEWMREAEDYERDLAAYRNARNRWDDAKLNYKPLPFEKEPEPPIKPSHYPVPLRPEPPEEPEPDTFDGSFWACLEEIQTHDFEAAGLKPIDVSEDSEIHVFNEPDKPIAEIVEG